METSHVPQNKPQTFAKDFPFDLDKKKMKKSVTSKQCNDEIDPQESFVARVCTDLVIHGFVAIHSIWKRLSTFSLLCFVSKTEAASASPLAFASGRNWDEASWGGETILPFIDSLISHFFSSSEFGFVKRKKNPQSAICRRILRVCGGGGDVHAHAICRPLPPFAALCCFR